MAQALLLDELKNVSYTTIETYRIGDTPTNITNTDLDGYRWPPRVQVHRPCLSAVEMGLQASCKRTVAKRYQTL